MKTVRVIEREKQQSDQRCSRWCSLQAFCQFRDTGCALMRREDFTPVTLSSSAFIIACANSMDQILPCDIMTAMCKSGHEHD